MTRELDMHMLILIQMVLSMNTEENIHLVRAQNFPKNLHFLPPDTNT